MAVGTMRMSDARADELSSKTDALGSKLEDATNEISKLHSQKHLTLNQAVGV